MKWKGSSWIFEACGLQLYTAKRGRYPQYHHRRMTYIRTPRTLHGGKGTELSSELYIIHPSNVTLENFIRFEKYKRCTKRKCFVIWVASHFTYNIVMYKRVKLNSYEPFARDKNMKFVTHSWYNKTLSFGTPFEFLKTYKIFQWKAPLLTRTAWQNTCIPYHA